MSNSYKSWQDLLEEEPECRERGAAHAGSDGLLTESCQSPSIASAADSSLTPVLPQEVQKLVNEQQRLEERLRVLTGDAEDRNVDARTKAMFPVPVHTNDTRIEERRMKRADEENHQAKLRLLERKAIEAKAAQEQRLAEEQLQRAALQERTLHRRLNEAKLQSEERVRAEQLTRLAATRKSDERRYQSWLEHQAAVQRRQLAARAVERKQKLAAEIEQRRQLEEARLNRILEDRQLEARQRRAHAIDQESARQENLAAHALETSLDQRREERSRDAVRTARRGARLQERIAARIEQRMRDRRSKRSDERFH